MTGLSSASRLVIGTVQFGLDYGITNRGGKVAPETAAAILDRARAHGIDMLDTAPDYGDSEAVIRRLDPHGDFRVVTKLPPVGSKRIEQKDADGLERRFEQSLSDLGRNTVDGLLVHHGRQVAMEGGETLVALLERLRADGRTARVGVSVYGAAEIDAILRRFTPDIIQLPINIADQRLVVSGHLARLDAAGVEIHARSLFLQGALLKPPQELPAFLGGEAGPLARIHARARDNGLAATELCLGFARTQPALGRFVVGVTSPGELDEIAAAETSSASTGVRTDDLSVTDPAIVDPSTWPVLENS